jgi:hypothetical protein
VNQKVIKTNFLDFDDRLSYLKPILSDIDSRCAIKQISVIGQNTLKCSN